MGSKTVGAHEILRITILGMFNFEHVALISRQSFTGPILYIHILSLYLSYVQCAILE